MGGYDDWVFYIPQLEISHPMSVFDIGVLSYFFTPPHLNPLPRRGEDFYEVLCRNPLSLAKSAIALRDGGRGEG